jgi:uncharacterized protein DUF3606
MSRLVLLLIAALGWAALTRGTKTKRLYGSRPDAFPFPTRDSRQGIDLDSDDSIRQWCATFDCDEHQLRAAVRNAGPKPENVRAHISRNR